MRKRWFVYQFYPAGRGVPSTLGALNKVRLNVESALRKRTRPYKWFTMLMKSESVLFGVKVEDGRSIKEQVENDLKNEHPALFIRAEDKDPDNCELMAIATQCRIKIEDKIPLAKWKGGQIGFIVHCMLNPHGLDDEAWTYWTSLCCIDEDKEIEDKDVKEVITLVRSFLEYKKGMELEDDYEKLELLMNDLDDFKKHLRKKSS
jgi:hypothetical protein